MYINKNFWVKKYDTNELYTNPSLTIYKTQLEIKLFEKRITVMYGDKRGYLNFNILIT